MHRSERSQPKGDRVIYSEDDVNIIEEDLKEMYPIFKWADHLKTIWVIVLLLQKARIDEGTTKAIMDYLVSSIENMQTRTALSLLSGSPLGKLMRLSTSEINRNRYWCSESSKWLEFCTGEERRRAISLGRTVVRTACQLHTILRKTMVQLVDDMPQEDARKVVMVAMRETYKLRCKHKSWGKRSIPLCGLIDPVIKRLNRLKKSTNIQADDLGIKLCNTGIDLQDVVGANAVWRWQSDQHEQREEENIKKG